MAYPLPEFIIRKLEGRTFDSFDHFSQYFWLAIAEDPIYSQQFIPAQLNRLKKGWPPRAPLHETARGLRCYRLCHLNPPEWGGPMYDAENLRIMSAMQYALSSETPW
ncbi:MULTISPECIES: S-type Pyocin [unclassified Pseudomonas]|jgi:filamentous hemagglutinin|nr:MULTISPECIES: S-type Pyocin [Pseudomonas]SNB74624.1 DNase/tRNase domain of colicin-like bacteriocin [Pseudomonas sp. URIL14HWK12:I8]SNT13297.1 DNase/tRNase domain of colicin-like bacteriocin [Pseudomonas sp. LAMO17WK12:I8]SNY22267.1 DNase/tRNase domain of colicin-like bacteriocin [Pseudomonas sp. LAMO17WK12:I12]SNY25379.1 DNase/tRNase domain of colicin-like bacteriocin [Pseudomonas sp. LAMO17WK12:I7]SNY26262.1 DNase/tRNase domain of colicin-like bacteriocin [Pseudomonas sp. LAMO17WK12:I11]